MRAAFVGLALAALVLETTVVPLLGLAGFRPQLLLLVTVFYAFLRGPAAGGGFGFLAGLLEDLVSGGIVGLGVLSFSIAGYLAGILHQHLIAESRALAFVMVALLTALQQGAYLLFLQLLGVGSPAPEEIATRVLPVIGANVALFLLIEHFRLRRIEAGGRLFPQKVGG